MCDIFLFDCESSIINYKDDTILQTCEPNIYLVLSKLEKENFTVFTMLQNSYLKANCEMSHLLTICDNILYVNIGGGEGNQLSSRKYEELLGILIDHKLTFKNHLLNFVWKVDQKIHAFARISNDMSQKKLIIAMKAFITSQLVYCYLPGFFHFS